MSRRDAGFSLIEALAALAAFAAILSALALVAGQWMPQWRHGFAALQSADAIAQSLDRVVADVSSAQFVRLDSASAPPQFRGDADALVFVREANEPDAGLALEYVRIGAVATPQGFETQRARARFLPGAIPPFGDAATLLRPPLRLKFAYQAPQGSWTTTWAAAPTLPRAIRLDVVSAGRPIASTAFLLKTPTGLEPSSQESRPPASAESGGK